MITPAQKARLESWNQRNAADASVAVNLDRGPKIVSVMWDFAVLGGESDTDINLGYTFEEDCLVTRVFMKEITNVVGATSTYTLEATATALTDAIAVASMATGSMALASSATAIAVASGSVLQLNIGTADATAGKVLFLIEILPARVN
jgi:hypothetical protein